MSQEIDYTPDKIATFPMELKGNSAEGNVYERAMSGYGQFAAPSRPGHNAGNGAPGAFIEGGNKYNNVPAGSAGSSNTEFTLGE